MSFPKPMKPNKLITHLVGLAAWCIMAVATAVAAPPASSSGPDSFGYKYFDSRHANGPEYNFIDISATGTRMTTVGDDVFQGVDLGFSFRFYDRDYTFCFITSNGFIQFGSGSTAYFPPSSLPSGLTPNNIIAAFWSDMNNAQGGNIYFSTLGAAPNRRFVVQYQDLKAHNGTTSNTFQIHLIESSNQIEIHYKKIDVKVSTTSPLQRFAIGIESLNGFPGLGYMNREHTAANHADIPADFAAVPPTYLAIKFTRPVKVTVETQYGSNKVTPIAGTYNREFQSVERFEAPEFIYFDRSFNELTEQGPTDAPEASRAYFRARNVGYAIDGESVQGVERFFERTITRDMKVIWRWELEYAVFIESSLGDGGGGDPSPALGRHWVKANTDFTATTAGNIEDDAVGIRVISKGYNVRNSNRVLNNSLSKSREPEGTRASTNPITVTSPIIIEWLWTGQVRYRFDAAGGVAGAGNLFADQAFVQVGGQTQKSSGPNRDVWVNTGEPVTVGAFYRTVDHCDTLVDFPAPLGGDLVDLAADISNFTDATVEGRAARTFLVPVAERPTEIHWLYQPTVFRAEVSLGMPFNPALTVPSLCGANPVLHDAGPTAGNLLPVGASPTGTASGTALRWDDVAGKLYPVQPGSNRIQWRDANIPGKSYQIEIVSGYPGDVMPLASERETALGYREGSSPNYVRQTPALAEVSAEFPAAPSAHYRHLVDPAAGRRPPTKLDLDPTDEWAFQELTYSDKNTDTTVTGSGQTAAFNASSEGRSVVLYSYRENPDEAADGNLTKEKLAVRVVQSSLIDPILPDDPKLVLGRRGLALDGTPAGLIQRGGNTTSSVNPGSDFVVDFWLNATGLRAGDAPVQILTTQGGKLKVTLDAATSTLTTTYLGVSATQPFSTAGPTWRHCVIHVFTDQFFGYDVNLLNFYVDGLREEQGMLLSPMGPASSAVNAAVDENSLRFGVGADPLSRLQIDQFRMFSLTPSNFLWLSAGELASLRIGSTPTLRSIAPKLHFDFEQAASGGSFANGSNLLPDVGLTGGTWARLDIQEVATRLDSTLDNAGFGGSGYILNEVSNYNANLYNRDAEVGTWGPVFPVNHGQLYLAANRRLEVAYYENPFLTDPTLNPNVAWPYLAAAYDEVIYPAFGPNTNNATYIASRIGSEGVDSNGRPQRIFDLSTYADLTIYNQPDMNQPGYNPNEEHAIVAASGLAGVKVKPLGSDIANNPPLAGFALQSDINSGTAYTSDPWMLVQVNNLVTGEPEMAAYQVFKTRGGSSSIPFPQPSDSTVNATDGLAYEGATTAGNRFLTIDPDRSYDFRYDFNYPVLAGDLLIPPYPLNLVIGNVSMHDERGGNVQVDGVNRRSLWRDVSGHAWVVSGGGRFFHQYFYPFRDDFYLKEAVEPGTPVAWLPENVNDFTGDNLAGTADPDDIPRPLKVNYTTAWRSDYPKLKRGETLTYQGGEYFNETPGANGLPAVVAMKAAELVFDAGTPDMVINDENVDEYSARVIRPLDRREYQFTVAAMAAAKFTPADQDKLFIVAERWYFKELPGSLQRRFYFDSLAQKLVFRGYLNDKDGGDPDLTAGPDPINTLEPNVVTLDDLNRLSNLSTDAAWITAVTAIFEKSRNPDPVRRLGDGVVTNINTDDLYLAGVSELPDVTLTNRDLTEDRITALTARANALVEVSKMWVGNNIGSPTHFTPLATSSAAKGSFVPLDSFGVGSALVPNPDLLTRPVDEPYFITIAENNRSELNGAPVSLHIIEIIPDRYRGAIKVIEGADAFSEKVTLQHNGEFGANTGNLYYEWWIRDATSLDTAASEVLSNGTLSQNDAQGNSLWQQYIPEDRASLTDEDAKHLGLNSIVFEGRPDVVLADKLVLMRYRHESETDWNLVPFDVANSATAWKPRTQAPFQWAGAANSPQLQADGSKRYIPQLVMGWVKRVLDRINPYEARYSDFFSNESPATYSSQIQIAGGPFVGKVALNPDKNVIENTGLIELYETVLARARELSIDNSTNPVSTDGINQALLLAATRLSTLYELLAREAYSDAQDSTITVTDDGGLASVASYTHAFQNMEADLSHEEMALLRGTDFGKSYPVYNRMFWNYTKGLGEAAYNVNYNIYDENTDGFINEDDARALYPQGHGDAWGHYLSAIKMPYTLLQHPGFSWKSRPELYSLMQNVLEVDFLDEKTFAKLAAGKARAGRDIVRGTYRAAYTQDPDGQWQGYTDGADPARAWGVSEWAVRAGQGAYFDWAVANSTLPEQAAGTNPENLDRIERSGAESEIGEVAGGLYEIQIAMDETNGGVNPLGFDVDGLTFDLNQEFYENESGGDRRSHFEQIYSRALTAGQNAMATLDFAAKADNKLRRISDDTDSLIVEAMRQDLDYRNRLIEIFGRPYDGTIGFGKAYPEGYEGPDTLLFAYLNRTSISEIVPQLDSPDDATTVNFNNVYVKRTLGVMSNPAMVNLYKSVWGSGAGNTNLQASFETLIGDNDYELEAEVGNLSLPFDTASNYGFVAPFDWGERTSYGKVQRALEEMLLSEIELDQAVIDYIGFLQDWEAKTRRLMSELELYAQKEGLRDDIDDIRKAVNGTIVAIETAIGAAELASDISGDVFSALQESLPTVVGFSNDVSSGIRAGIISSKMAAQSPLTIVKKASEIAKLIAELARDEAIFGLERDLVRIEMISELEGRVEELVNLSGSDQPKRDAIGIAVQSLELNRQDYFTAQAEGFRLLREREAFNKVLAAKAQKNRYQDMILRLSRNEAMSKHQTSFNHAARYAWLAARAYDYETSLEPGNPAAPGPVFDQIVKERQLGLWSDGLPQAGQGGLAEILNHMNGNFQVLKGQLGISNPQSETGKISLRSELFRIGESGLAASDNRWKDALNARIVPNLNALPEFVRHCRPFSTPLEGDQAGIVIRFSTHINNGVNFFGQPLIAGDHAYSTANFATKVRGFGVWLDNYNAAGLSTSPRGYLVPIGNDYLRLSSSAESGIRMFGIQEQRIPTPFVINQGNLSSPGFIPTLNGVDGSFGQLRRHGDFRMYHDNDVTIDESELTFDTRLIGRSVWNSEWMLIIPGAGLHVDPMTGLMKLADHVSDIKLHFKTYSHQGQ
jgi:hypothetical protein